MRNRLVIGLICAASMALIGCESKKMEPKKEAPKADPAKPATTPPTDTSAPRSEEKPAETKPAETTPAETKPAATTPSQTPPAETKPPEDPAEEKPGPPIVRDNGLIIEDLKIGKGQPLPPGGALVFHYRGILKADGKEFQTSYGGEPVAYPLNDLIKGWQEGIPGMKIGGKRKLTIPWQLGYGEEGRPGTIPPKADLVFEIELVNFVQVEDLKIGDGPECRPGQTVRVFYSGTFLSNGEPFASNVGDEPLERPLAGLVRGWQYGVPGMKVGGKRKLIIPYQFAYGEAGRPGIPPKSDLVFEIELLAVK